MKRLLLLLLSTFSTGRAATPLDPLLAFARTQPHDLAVSTYALQADGTPDTARHTLNWNSTQPMPLASSMKIVVLAAYARAVASGTLDAQQPVTLRDWEGFYLPGTDGGAHASSLKTLGLPADRSGRANTPDRTVPLDTLARFMIETSDNAATDLILSRLGPQAIRQTATRLHLTGQDDIGPVAGMFSTWDTPRDQTALLTMTAAQRTALYWQRAEQVRQDPSLRDPAAVQRRARAVEPATANALQNRSAPAGTTRDYAALMARVLTGAGLPDTELQIMRRHLGWPMRVNPGNDEVFTRLYAKGGSLSGGVLTSNLAFTPKVGPAAGHPLVVSVFLRNVPAGQYRALQDSLDEALLMIAIRPDLAQQLTDALGTATPKK
jgi:beta-lactamase class A